jgi:hypothetical protein
MKEKIVINVGTDMTYFQVEVYLIFQISNLLSVMVRHFLFVVGAPLDWRQEMKKGHGASIIHKLLVFGDTLQYYQYQHFQFLL